MTNANNMTKAMLDFLLQIIGGKEQMLYEEVLTTQEIILAFVKRRVLNLEAKDLERTFSTKECKQALFVMCKRSPLDERGLEFNFLRSSSLN